MEKDWSSDYEYEDWFSDGPEDIITWDILDDKEYEEHRHRHRVAKIRRSDGEVFERIPIPWEPPKKKETRPMPVPKFLPAKQIHALPADPKYPKDAWEKMYWDLVDTDGEEEAMREFLTKINTEIPAKYQHLLETVARNQIHIVTQKTDEERVQCLLKYTNDPLEHSDLRGIWTGCFKSCSKPGIRWINLKRMEYVRNINKNKIRDVLTKKAFSRITHARMPSCGFQAILYKYGLDNDNWVCYKTIE